ncbi:MAG TPA: CoA transferase [Acidimicrobiales bacterium]
MTSPCEPRRPGPGPEPAGEPDAWAASGAMWLTGRRGSPPLGPPAGMVPKLRAVGDAIDRRSAVMGTRVRVDPLALLGERAAIAGLARRGTTSCGGATRLVRTADRWLAVTLARADDVDLVPAWLEIDPPGDDVWAAVASVAATAAADRLLERALVLGLPAAVLPAPAPPHKAGSPPWRAVQVPGPAAAPAPRLAGLSVVDLSALWAGPLCGALLADAGADVVKVESTGRPDGARRGPRQFFDLLNAGKRSVALDLGSAEGRARLHELLARADVVIEASRPRALADLGVDAGSLVAGGGPRVWLSITGHGRRGPGRDRVGFGDDAAVAGGLVSRDGRGPCFCADAVADPATGLVATAAVLDVLAAGGRWLLDVAMSAVAAHLAGPTLPVADQSPVAARPWARPPRGPAPRLGEHTAAVLGRPAPAR